MRAASRGGDPVLVFGKNRFCGDIRTIVERKQQIAMAGCIIRLHRQGLVVAFLRLGMAALREQRHSQVGQPAELVRCQRYRGAARGFGRDGETGTCEQGSEVAVSQCIARIQHECVTQCAERFRIAVQREQQGSQIAMGGGTGRAISHGMAKCVERVIEAPLALKRLAEAIPGIRIVPPGPERRAKCCFSLGIASLLVQQVAQVVVGDGKPWVERNCVMVSCFRLVVSPERLQRGSQIGIFRRLFADRAECGLCEVGFRVSQ